MCDTQPRVFRLPYRRLDHLNDRAVAIKHFDRGSSPTGCEDGIIKSGLKGGIRQIIRRSGVEYEKKLGLHCVATLLRHSVRDMRLLFV